MPPQNVTPVKNALKVFKRGLAVTLQSHPPEPLASLALCPTLRQLGVILMEQNKLAKREIGKEGQEEKWFLPSALPTI